MATKCPCCGYYTLAEGDTDYDICPVCFWENDPWQAKEPEETGGANGVSLKQARENFVAFGVCEERFAEKVRKPYCCETYRIVSLCECMERAEEAAEWFHEKWGVPKGAYLVSMRDALTTRTGVPAWYVALGCENRIIGGVGVVENDFHERSDLTPNVCALFVEPQYRNLGIAGALLSTVCKGLKADGVSKAYLVTDHTSFYERYGWHYYGQVRELSGEETRMYTKEW